MRVRCKKCDGYLPHVTLKDWWQNLYKNNRSVFFFLITPSLLSHLSLSTLSESILFHSIRFELQKRYASCVFILIPSTISYTHTPTFKSEHLLPSFSFLARENEKSSWSFARYKCGRLKFLPPALHLVLRSLRMCRMAFHES